MDGQAILADLTAFLALDPFLVSLSVVRKTCLVRQNRWANLIRCVGEQRGHLQGRIRRRLVSQSHGGEACVATDVDMAAAVAASDTLMVIVPAYGHGRPGT